MTREEIIALAKRHGASAYTNRHYQDETYMTFSPEKLESFFRAAQKLEREECAKACMRLETAIDGGGDAYYRPADARQCVAAIRNRGNQ